MRLSEAMMLGDSLRTRSHVVYLDMETVPPCGCAIGGSALAVGATLPLQHREVWPWLSDLLSDRILDYECIIGCGVDISFSRVMDGSCTFEKLVDYVRSIEPSCGDCNCFECSCINNSYGAEAIYEEKEELGMVMA